ncbi:MAG: hypothetical protein HUJ71_09675 [Pseudobutyrivibrio sp.]|nr:hypothetical protein [Pseudobutyrivibrio sp.]
MGKKSKKKKLLLSIAITVTSGMLLAGGGFVAYQKLTFQPYVKTVSLSEEAAAKALIWLSDIEGNILSYEDVHELMGTIELQIDMIPTDTRGVYAQTLDEDSYDSCQAMAEEGLRKAFCQVVIDELLAEGYQGTADYNTVEELMQETYGISVEEYLGGCKVELIPSFESLDKKYSKEVTDEKN